MKYCAILILTFALSVFCVSAYAQQTATDSLSAHTESSLEEKSDTVDLSISDYDKYTPLLGGKEKRLRSDGLVMNGMVKDYYPDSTLKHKGYYQNGQLVSTYKNYYPDGSLERSFTAKGTNKVVLQTYYPNGKSKVYMEFHKGEMIKYIEYWPNGKMSYYEEHDKKKAYYISLKNYYADGRIKDELVLVDPKKLVYEQKEYFPDGKIKESGKVLYNKVYMDYFKDGKWKVFNPDGSVKEVLEYDDGELIQ